MATVQALSVVRQLAAKSVRTHRNVRAASCLWYGEKIHVAVAQEVPGTGVIPLKILSAFALKCANFTSRPSANFGRSVVPLRFSSIFLFTIDLIQVTSFILALIMKAVAL